MVTSMVGVTSIGRSTSAAEHLDLGPDVDPPANIRRSQRRVHTLRAVAMTDHSRERSIRGAVDDDRDR